MITRKRLQQFLEEASSYPEPTHAVEKKETHISEVYLTDQYAFKFKKHLELPFLNYATLEARHEACQAELQLNRRFSHDIYLDVVGVHRQGADGLSWEGDGPVVEYAVQMRRIPHEDLLDQRIKDHRLGSVEIQEIVQHLLHCFSRVPKASLDPTTYVQRLGRHVEENRSTLFEVCSSLGVDPLPWMALCAQQSLFLRLHPILLEERVRLARVVEGHGDLRPEHIALDRQRVAVIDGVEFSRDLRTLDIADELSFLALECAVLGQGQLGAILREGVLAALDDHPSARLLDFYETYRATVRAKVSLMRALQLEGEQRAKYRDRAGLYLELAQERIHRIQSPFVFVVTGPMGSGKTTLAQALKRDLGVEHIESDRIRREQFGVSAETAGFGEGHYELSARAEIYERMRQLLEVQLRAGMPTVVDASFGEASLGDRVLSWLAAAGVPYLIVVCECPDPIALERIRQRLRHGHGQSEARPELYQQQKHRGDWSFVGHPVVRVLTVLSPDHQLHEVYRAAQKLFESREQGDRLL
ncbi:MAG: AAA family ATPase [Oligoflexus sp.]